MKATSAITFIIMALLFLAQGCTRPLVEPARPEAVSREEWIGRLENRSQAWKSFHAQLRIHVESSKGKFSARTVVIASLPDQIRIEAFSPFGQTASLLILDRAEGKSGLLVPSERVLYTAGKPETLISRFLGAGVPLGALGYSLAACVPPDYVRDIKLVPGEDKLLGYAKPQGRPLMLTWQFLTNPPALRAFDVREEAGEYTVSYEPAVGLDPSAVPQKIRYLASEWQMDVTVDQMRSSEAVSEATFKQTVPAGIRKVDLDKGL